jgi:hypothetical protein
MNVPSLQRRKMLFAISQLVLAGTLSACGGASEPPPQAATPAESDLELLAAVSYDLFPFPDLPPSLYVQVGERLLQASNPVVTEGLTQLRASAGNSAWKDIDEATRVATLTAMQATSFFAAVRAASLEVLYRAPETFAMVGYGGSAIEQGGYLNRGFDQIDWLPLQQQ